MYFILHCILYCIAFYIALHCIALHLKARQFDGGVVRRLERRIPIGDPEAWKPLITQSDYCIADLILYCRLCTALLITILATTVLPITILATALVTVLHWRLLY